MGLDVSEDFHGFGYDSAIGAKSSGGDVLILQGPVEDVILEPSDSALELELEVSKVCVLGNGQLDIKPGVNIIRIRGVGQVGVRHGVMRVHICGGMQFGLGEGVSIVHIRGGVQHVLGLGVVGVCFSSIRQLGFG